MFFAAAVMHNPPACPHGQAGKGATTTRLPFLLQHVLQPSPAAYSRQTSVWLPEHSAQWPSPMTEAGSESSAKHPQGLGKRKGEREARHTSETTAPITDSARASTEFLGEKWEQKK
jgi:hypothetical protein